MTTTIARSKLVTREPFSTLFPIGDLVKTSVTDSMRKDGFDPYRPVRVWKDGDDLVVLDGHTRLFAADRLGIKTIPYALVTTVFDKDGALAWAFREQRDRRNLTQKELRVFWVRAVAAVGPGLKSGDANKYMERTKGFSFKKGTARIPEGIMTHKRVGKLIGASSTTVVHIRKVLATGDDKLKRQMLDGQIAIKDAYKKVTATAPAQHRAHRAQVLSAPRKRHQGRAIPWYVKRYPLMDGWTKDQARLALKVLKHFESEYAGEIHHLKPLLVTDPARCIRRLEVLKGLTRSARLDIYAHVRADDAPRPFTVPVPPTSEPGFKVFQQINRLLAEVDRVTKYERLRILAAQVGMQLKDELGKLLAEHDKPVRVP